MLHYSLLIAIALAAAGPVRAGTADSPEEVSAIDRRVALERRTHENRFSITPHRPTYVLPVAYSSRLNSEPYDALPEYPELQPVEIKFQFSFKIPIERDLVGTGDLVFGYTQQSYWQAYNGDYSSPFRETNHEPEVMLSFDTDFNLFGWRNRFINVALNHQSNGRGEPLSRSWNRVTLEAVMEQGDTYVSFRPWWRVPEDESEDDNPDIEKYMGNFELTALQEAGSQTFGLTLRNNLRADNRGAVRVDWTFPLRGRLQGYLQYFNGYGESLIDYNYYSNRVGVGVMLTNWL